MSDLANSCIDIEGFAGLIIHEPILCNYTPIGDECLYFEAGGAVVETVFGDLAAGEGDYVILPRATTHRIVPDGTARIYAIEGNSHIGPARRYLSANGQFLEHAPYCERDLRGPGAPRVVDETGTEVYIKHRLPGAPGGIGGTVHTLARHPFDVVGWDGCLYPFAFNVADFMPITGKVQGSVSLHPGGFPHGPQPGAYERSIGAEFFDELAVMVDTFRPLELGEAAREADDGIYAYSWSRGDK